MVPIIRRNRILENEDDVFSQNAWDNTQWTSEMIDAAKQRIQQQIDESKRLSEPARLDEIELKVSQKWDDFYMTHGDKFFKDRQWIFSEFPEILAHLNVNSEPCNLLEVGCGVGNAVTHIIGNNRNPNMHIYCCDLSASAIETLQRREFYQQNMDKITAFQADISKDFDNKICEKIPKDSLDFITIIFTLSALKPEVMNDTIFNLVSLLKPGGLLLFRDYAQYDLAQLRFKGRSYLGENYYVRSDGTTSYFFTKEIVDHIFVSAGLIQLELKEDNRLLVNRLKSLKMCRRWIQAKYKKDLTTLKLV